MKLEKNAKGLYEIEIDGHQYEYSVWRFRRTARAAIELSAICGEFLAKTAALFAVKGAMQREVDGDAIGGIVRALTDGVNADSNRTMALIEKLTTEGVSRNGKPVDFDVDFERQFAHMFKVLRYGIEVQFGDFSDVERILSTGQTPT